MKLTNGMLALAAAFAATITVPSAAIAQQRGTQEQRSTNAQAAADLRGRIGMTEARIADGQRRGRISPAGADALRRQVDRTRSSLDRLSRKQGFVSAAELASYHRTLATVDAELDRRGVARGYGNDALVAPADDHAAELRYDCQDAPVEVAIPGERLDAALAQLRLVTRCPISGTDLARGKRSRPVVGTMTPTNALQAMLNGTGLQMRPIKGGFQVVPLPRR